MGRVSKAFDRLTGQTVALKQIAIGLVSHRASVRQVVLEVTADQFETETFGLAETAALAHTQIVERIDEGVVHVKPHTEESEIRRQRLALAQEFRTLSSCRHPNIISVLDYGFADDDQPYFTMELLEAAQPFLTFAAGQPPSVQIDLFAQLLTALFYLHRHEVIHRDIKPSNVLVELSKSGALPRVKVLDFGLAVLRQQSAQRSESVVGTVAYMAPELLYGNPASVASDLYAVAVMACEVLLGAHPFDADGEQGALISQILHQAPELSKLANARLAAVLERGLAKAPQQRPADALSFMRELAEATGFALPKESVDARESYLIAAPFIGRDSEMAELSGALTRAAHGDGSAWLVGGHSGIGKSRLLDELRSIALVSGVLVLRGQALPVGSTPYLLFRDAIRLLSLHIEIDDQTASALSKLAPDLQNLIGRKIEAPPALDGQAEQLRLMQSVIGLLSTQSEPLLFLIEDLHWADSESLTLLRQVARLSATRSWMVVATFRSEETPKLPDELPEMRALYLERLAKPQVQRLCESMLGAKGRDSEMLRVIEREAEGNTYFLIEIVRALAEDSGSLTDVGKQGIAQVQRGSLMAVLQRRLDRIPVAAQPLLRLAAVEGRELDLVLFQQILPHAEKLAEICADLGVLEMHEQVWRFSHDKLREFILATLPKETRTTLHAWLAEAIEQVYPDTRQQAARLAYHHNEAGQHDEAMRYYAQAGEVALSRGALSDAISSLEQAATLQEEADRSGLDVMRVYCLLAKAYFATGQNGPMRAAMYRAAALTGEPWPAERGALAVASLREAIEQARRRLGRRRAPTLQSNQRALLAQLLTLVPEMQAFIVMGEPMAAIYGWLHGLNLAEDLQDKPAQIHAATMLSYVLSSMWLRGPSRYYQQMAEQALAASQEQQQAPWLRLGQAVLAINEARWQEARRLCVESIPIARSLGNPVHEMRSLRLLGMAHLAAGELREALRIAEQILAPGPLREHPTLLGLAPGFRGLVLARQGNHAAAEPDLAQATKQARSSQDQNWSLMLGGTWALCALRQGHFDEAEVRAAPVLRIMRENTSMMSLNAFGIAGIAEVYLHLGKNRRGVGVKEELDIVVAHLERLALRFPIAKPIASHYWARVQSLRGRHAAAVVALQLSLHSAETLQMPYEQAQAHYWLGRLGDSGSLARRILKGSPQSHRSAAQQLFEKIGATWDAAQAAAEN